MDIGTKIKMVRIAQSLTLDQLAEMCEVSKGFLSKIENNKVVPSIARLINIARAMKINVSVLIDDDGTLDEEFIKNNDRGKYTISHTENGYDYVPFAPNVIPKQMHPFLFIAKKGEIRNTIYRTKGKSSYISSKDLSNFRWKIIFIQWKKVTACIFSP